MRLSSDKEVMLVKKLVKKFIMAGGSLAEEMTALEIWRKATEHLK